VKLSKAEIRNFKLLEEVILEFSTDANCPLTVVRAENGSGKTSLLYALLWGFYGMRGLPAQAAETRLTSAAAPASKPIDIQVMLEFEHTDENGLVTKYRLLRGVTETPGSEKPDRSKEKVSLFKITAAGEDKIEPASALIEKLVPLHLRDVFFTNGDDIQTFISGKAGDQQRQEKVHEAIRSLLGLDILKAAADDLEVVARQFRSEASRSGGADVAAAEQALEKTEDEIKALEQTKKEYSESLANMMEQRAQWDKELTALRGIGDIDELNKRIEGLRRDMSRLEGERGRTFTGMRELLRAEEFSWAAMQSKLDDGLARLADLADRNIIPGASVEVLNDRLELGVCICGESLTAGTPHRHKVEELREAQRSQSQSRQRLTALYHLARQSKAGQDAKLGEEKDFTAQRLLLLGDITRVRDDLNVKGLELRNLEDRRKQIDESRVRQLTDRIDALDAQIAQRHKQLGSTQTDLASRQALREEQDLRLREAQKSAKVNDDLIARRDIAEDLRKLASNTLRTLERDHVRRVSERMNELFMEIVGAHPGLSAVFTGVYIQDDFDIVVESHNQQLLDTDFELNGASQRALTLSFIWALMEISGVTAPRIIDTPLGMVAGGVKTRMVDVVTRPAVNGGPDFQVVLLLTRSEVRDVEDLLDRRAGTIRTMSCSKDYPVDLVHDWGVDKPVVRICKCTHRQSCRICARRYDEKHAIAFRDVEG
jgi:DNA sulfur modification protein DndD